MSVSGMDPPESSDLVDTWDQPEFDDDDMPGGVKRKVEEGKDRDDDSLSKKSKVKSVKEITKDLTDSTELSETVNRDAEMPSQVGSFAPEIESAQPRKRRSFCNFHYRTTQGGSSTVEPGDDPSMQSPGTQAKATVTLLEFTHDEGTPFNLP